MLLSLFVIGGCAASEKHGQKALDTLIVRTIQDGAIKNAIIAQHALFPYHFDHDSDVLNELGRSDLVVLADHFRENRGTLGVRRGEAKSELYANRVKAIREMLARAGVDEKRVAISDSLAGGDGMMSERVLEILGPMEDENRSGSERRDTAGRSGSRSGSTSGSARTSNTTRSGGR